MARRKIKVTAQEYKYEAQDMLYEALDEYIQELHARIMDRQFVNNRLTQVESDILITELGKAVNSEMTKLAKRWDIDLPEPQLILPETQAAD